jgi:2-keto-4-pentenoate hydratase
MEAPGYTGPELSPLLDAGMLRNGDPVSLGKYLTPYIGGPELAFIISEDLTGPAVTTARVLQSLAGVIPAIELCDSRMGLPFPTTADVIADQGGAAGVLLHSRLTPITDIDVRTVGLVVEKNGRLIDTGAGAEAFGNPIEVVAWLANSLAKYNERLVAGQFVITGELVPTIDLKAGDVVTAHFDRLGILSIAFIK